jgi:hypothetical protein
MLLRKAPLEENIVDRSRERNVNNAARVHMADFGSTQPEFPPAKAMRVSGNTRPGGELVLELPQVVHGLSSGLTGFDDLTQAVDSNPRRFTSPGEAESFGAECNAKVRGGALGPQDRGHAQAGL